MLKPLPENQLLEMRTRPDMVPWSSISRTYELTESIMREFQDYFDWVAISTYQTLPESIIRELKDHVIFKGRIIWVWISMCQTLSEPFILEYQNLVKWPQISMCQKLSESFIRECQDLVEWPQISMFQKLSDEFAAEFADRLPAEHRQVAAVRHHCGVYRRPIVIYRDDVKQIVIGCRTCSQADAIEAVRKKYGDSKDGAGYITAINECFEEAALSV